MAKLPARLPSTTALTQLMAAHHGETNKPRRGLTVCSRIVLALLARLPLLLLLRLRLRLLLPARHVGLIDEPGDTVGLLLALRAALRRQPVVRQRCGCLEGLCVG